MKNYFTFLLLIFFHGAFAQLPQVQWTKCYGGSANDRAYSVISTSEGGYVMCGFTNSNDGDVTFNHGDSDAWVIKTDLLGNIEWQKSYGGSNSDLFKSIIATTDGGYLACGETGSSDGDVTFNHGMTDAWVVKIDSDGNMMWQNTYGGSDVETANDIVISDSGFFVVGQTFSDDGDVHNYKDSGDAWFLSIDSTGLLVDSKTKGGHAEDGYNNIIATSFGGFLVSGFTFSNDGSVEGLNHGGSDAWLVKLGKTGSLQWTYCYGGLHNDGAYNAIQNQDGHYILSGWYTDSLNQNSWFFSLDSAGLQISDANYGGDSSEYAGPVLQNYLSTYVVAPASSSEISGDLNCHIGAEDIWLYETETTGGLNWQKCLGGSGNERSTSSLFNSDSTFTICGYTNSTDGDVSGNHGDYDWWLVKLVPGCSVHAGFTWSGTGATLAFTNTSVNDTAWQWDFGDGGTSTVENPLHTFPGLGTFNVCLIATAGNCLPDTLCVEITLCGQPAEAAFTYTISGSEVTFDNNSLHSTIWSWTFGDSTTSDALNPTHTYTANGTYEVCLVATYEGCSSDTLCQTLTICAFPTEASFTYVINGAEVDFTDTSPSAISWVWNFGDGLNSSIQNPIHIYTSDGVYEACLTISDGCGSDTTCQTITLCIPPNASFGFSVSGNTTDFVDQSDNVTGWFWMFGDDSTSTSPNPTHTYANGGTYNVCLIASNSCGNDTICQDVMIECPPFDGAYVFTQSNDTVQFTDQSVNAIEWSWDFGDGTTSTEQNPLHIYEDDGTYLACLIVTDGCSSDTICQDVIVIGTALNGVTGNETMISTYPNPFSESTTVQLALNSNAHITIDLLDVNGKKLMNVADKNFSAGIHELIISAKGLPAGIYFMRLIYPDGNSMQKLIIQ